jgi:hypothetical protein
MPSGYAIIKRPSACALTPIMAVGCGIDVGVAIVEPLTAVVSFNCEPVELATRCSFPFGLELSLGPWPFRSLTLAVSDFASSWFVFDLAGGIVKDRV